jgi:hypothetical protein
VPELPLRLFPFLLERFGGAVQRSALDEGWWHGHHTFLFDGSGCSMPDTPALQGALNRRIPRRTTPTRRCQSPYLSWASEATVLKVIRSIGAGVSFPVRVLDLVSGGHYNPSCRVWPMAQGHPLAAIAKGG